MKKQMGVEIFMLTGFEDTKGDMRISKSCVSIFKKFIKLMIFGIEYRLLVLQTSNSQMYFGKLEKRFRKSGINM